MQYRCDRFRRLFFFVVCRFFYHYYSSVLSRVRIVRSSTERPKTAEFTTDRCDDYNADVDDDHNDHDHVKLQWTENMNESVTVCSSRQLQQQGPSYHHGHGGGMPAQCNGGDECTAEPQPAAVAGSWTAYGHQPVTTAAVAAAAAAGYHHHHHHHLQQQQQLQQQQDHHLHHPHHGMSTVVSAPQPLLHHHHHHHQPSDGGGYAAWPTVMYNKRRPSYADDVVSYHHAAAHHAQQPPPLPPPHHQPAGSATAATLQAVAAYNPVATSASTATCSSPGTSLDEPSSAASTVAAYQTANDYKYWPPVQHQPSPTGTGRVSPYGWMKRVEYQDRPQPGKC